MIGKVPIIRVAKGEINKTEDVVAKESSLTIILDDQEIATLRCSPAKQEYLALGFLLSQNLINSKEEIIEVIVDEEAKVARVQTRGNIFSAGDRGNVLNASLAERDPKVKSNIHIRPDEIFALVEQFHGHCQTYRETGGTHCSALCDACNIVVSSEDIGRHNTIDKVFGECFARDIPTADLIVLTSGRASSEMLRKIAQRDVPVVASISAPTESGIKLADERGITLLGFVREKRINVYTNNWRLLT